LTLANRSEALGACWTFSNSGTATAPHEVNGQFNRSVKKYFTKRQNQRSTVCYYWLFVRSFLKFTFNCLFNMQFIEASLLDFTLDSSSKIIACLSATKSDGLHRAHSALGKFRENTPPSVAESLKDVLDAHG
jgi:hypothetical protein